MDFATALSLTKDNQEQAARLPEWPKVKCIWYHKGPLYPGIMLRDGKVFAPVAIGEGLDADDMLRRDWQMCLR